MNRRIPRQRDTQLRISLEARTHGATGSSKQEIAREAGVSTRTVQQVLSGEYAQPPPTESTSERQLRGYAEALTRLAIYLSLDPNVVVEEYGLDLSWRGVSAAIRRAQRRQEIFRRLSDPILDAIQDRENHVNVGILIWPPFATPDDVVRDQLGRSWSARYTRRLLGTVHPFWKLRLVPISEIGGAISALQRNVVDVVFGLYDTPYRRLLGLSFVHVPGIGIPLAALSTNPTITWTQITQRSRDVVAAAIRNEVGHLYLRAICDYDEEGSDFSCLDEDKPKSPLIERIANEIELASESKRSFVFVADRVTCSQVLHGMAPSSRLWLDKISDGARRERIARIVSQNPLKLVPEVPTTVPIYRLGLAVRADAWRLRQLLEEAQRDDLFRIASENTSRQYVELFSTAASDSLRPLPLDQLPTPTALGFCEQVAELAKTSEVASETARRFVDTWLRPHEKVNMGHEEGCSQTPEGKVSRENEEHRQSAFVHTNAELARKRS